MKPRRDKQSMRGLDVGELVSSSQLNCTAGFLAGLPVGFPRELVGLLGKLLQHTEPKTQVPQFDLDLIYRQVTRKLGQDRYFVQDHELLDPMDPISLQSHNLGGSKAKYSHRLLKHFRIGQRNLALDDRISRHRPKHLQQIPGRPRLANPYFYFESPHELLPLTNDTQWLHDTRRVVGIR